MAYINNTFNYKYFGDYELTPEQKDAVYEAWRIARAYLDLLPLIEESRRLLSEWNERAAGSILSDETDAHLSKLSALLNEGT